MISISFKGLVNGFSDVMLLLTSARPKKRYGPDGKATDFIEAVRLTAASQEVGTITVDLFPFSEEKLERCSNLFGQTFTVSDLVGVENCRISIYHEELRVVITAADLQPKIEL